MLLSKLFGSYLSIYCISAEVFAVPLCGFVITNLLPIVKCPYCRNDGMSIYSETPERVKCDWITYAIGITKSGPGRPRLPQSYIFAIPCYKIPYTRIVQSMLIYFNRTVNQANQFVPLVVAS